jgi:hypothetical protein
MPLRINRFIGGSNIVRHCGESDGLKMGDVRVSRLGALAYSVDLGSRNIGYRPLQAVGETCNCVRCDTVALLFVAI